MCLEKQQIFKIYDTKIVRTKREINKSTIMVGDINNAFSVIKLNEPENQQ